jgi:hypothetical protein
LFVSTTPFVEIRAFVITTGGALTMISFVDGIVPDTTLVDAGGFDPLFPQPATFSMTIPNIAAAK